MAQTGFVGLGRMGTGMTRRVLRAGHGCHVYDRDAALVQALEAEGAHPASSLEQLVKDLERPRHIWLMVPAAVVDTVVDQLAGLLEPGDTVIDGGNSHYHDDLRRAASLKGNELHYVDVGTSGGVWGEDRGYCLMIGGESEVVAQLEPIFEALAPGVESASRTPGRTGEPAPAEKGWLHCGPPGAGHFVKMVHNGIEYGLMAAYAEGLNILKHANIGLAERQVDAETTPLRHPEHFAYDLDVAGVAEVWRRGSVIASWLLDLTADALATDPGLDGFDGHVSDSGEGRWTLQAAIEAGVPVPAISAGVYQRFSSRGNDGFALRTLSAMRLAFGGHIERKASDHE